MPGNTFLPALQSGLQRDSVINITALVTLNKTDLDEVVGVLPEPLMATVSAGLRLVLGL
jgi:mRNA interferase MazF